MLRGNCTLQRNSLPLFRCVGLQNKKLNFTFNHRLLRLTYSLTDLPVRLRANQPASQSVSHWNANQTGGHAVVSPVSSSSDLRLDLDFLVFPEEFPELFPVPK